MNKCVDILKKDTYCYNMKYTFRKKSWVDRCLLEQRKANKKLALTIDALKNDLSLVNEELSDIKSDRLIIQKPDAYLLNEVERLNYEKSELVKRLYQLTKALSGVREKLVRLHGIKILSRYDEPYIHHILSDILDTWNTRWWKE